MGASYEWTVDTAAPDAPQLSGAPSGSTNSTDASISFDGEGTFTCSVDGGAYEPCTSPQSFSGLADGPHSFAVKATDAAGNESQPASASWTVDTIAPAKPVLGDLTNSNLKSNINEQSFSITPSEDGGRVECTLGDGPWEPCFDRTK